ncbi:endonuclease toxin domain-containing protein [Streptosporangium sandarakinum]
MGRKLLHVVALIAFLFVLLSEAPALASASDPCAPHRAGLKLVQAEIARHNAAMPPSTAPAATINAYNQEARVLNKAQADSLKALRSCLTTRPGRNSALWKLTPDRRGFAIERMYGENLPNNFPTIDRWVKRSGTATSIKSVDLRSKSYATRPAAVKGLIKDYIDSVAGFAKRKPVSYGGTTIRPSQVKHRQLLVAFPEGQATAAHKRVLEDLKTYAAQKKVTLMYRYVR